MSSSPVVGSAGRWLRGSWSGSCRAVGPAGAGQRRQLHALHAVPARGRGGDAGAAPRGHAAAGDPQAHQPAAGDDRRARPRRPHRAAAQPRRRDRGASLRPAAARPRLGLAGAAGPGPERARDRLQEPRRRDLAAQPRDRDAGGGQRDRRPRPPRRAAHLRLRRRRLRRPGGARRAPGLRRRRDRELPAGPPARDALGPGRGRRPGPPRDRRRARRVRAARAARPRHRHPPRHDAGGGARRVRPDLDRRDAADPDRRLDRRRRPQPEPARALGAARRARPRSRRRAPAGAGHGLRLGDRRLRRGARPARRHLPADRPARGPPGPGRRPQHRRRARGRQRGRLRLPRQRRLRQPRPLQGGRPGRRPHLPRLPGLVDGAHLPHEPDPGRRPQGARGDRLDREPAVQARPGRGRVDRPPGAPGRDNGAHGIRVPAHRPPLRPSDRVHRPRQGQLVLALADRSAPCCRCSA